MKILSLGHTAIFIFALLISGCGHDYEEAARPMWDNYAQVRQKMRTFFVPWNPKYSQPSRKMILALEEFLQSLGNLSGDDIYVEYFAPSNLDRAPIPGESEAKFLAESIRTHFNLTSQVKVVQASDYSAKNNDACGHDHQGLMIVVDRYELRLPNCDNYDQPFGDASHVQDYKLGCANNRNLAMMISNPKDLINQRLPDLPPSYPLLNIVERNRQTTTGSNVNTSSSSGGGSGSMGSSTSSMGSSSSGSM